MSACAKYRRMSVEWQFFPISTICPALKLLYCGIGIRLSDVLEKRRLDQALNTDEFAVCAGISNSTARRWFHLPGFPAFRGVVFWQDFVQWRSSQNRFADQADNVSINRVRSV